MILPTTTYYTHTITSSRITTLLLFNFRNAWYALYDSLIFFCSANRNRHDILLSILSRYFTSPVELYLTHKYFSGSLSFRTTILALLHICFIYSTTDTRFSRAGLHDGTPQKPRATGLSTDRETARVCALYMPVDFLM
jgi:hypothetical protein